MADKDISVIIVTFNCGDYLVDLFNDFLGTYLNSYIIEILVIDNGDIALRDIVMNYGSDKVLYYRTPLNVGFAVACNFGVGISRGKRILFINPDVGNLNLKDFKIAFDSIHPVVFLGSMEDKSVWTNRNPVPSIQKITSLFTKKFRSETYYMDGSFMLISKSVFLDVGGYENFFLYGEDLFLFKKLINRCSDIMFFGDGDSFVHFRGSSTTRRHKFIDSKFYAELKYLKENSNIVAFYSYGILRILLLSLILLRDILKRPSSIVFLLSKNFSILKVFFLLNFKDKLDTYHSNLKLI